MSQSLQNGWKAAFDVFKNDNALGDDAVGVFAINLRFNLDDVQTIASEAITGGGDDKKCDILYVDKERAIAVVAQCYIARSPKPAAPSNKASDLNTAVAWLLSTAIDKLPPGLRGRADELRSAIDAGDIKQFFVWYVHNLPCSKNVQEELRTVEHAARAALNGYKCGPEINIFAEEICDSALSRLYIQAERTVIVTDEISTVVTDAIEIKANEWSSVITSVSGSWLYDLYRTYKTDLFSANVRGYLGLRESDSNINNGIKRTAIDEPANFFVYNNGVTALVLDYKLGARTKRGRKIRLSGISIVNGAQTTGSLASIGHLPSEDLRVPIRFVKAARDAIVASVVRYNNSQNKLQAADFRSTDAIQERLRLEFEAIPEAEYEGGRRGGASDVIRRSKYTLPSYTVGQSLAAFHFDPVTAYDRKSELWTNEFNYRRMFTERTTARHIVFCYSLLSSINKRKIELSGRFRIDSSALTVIEKRNLEFLNKKGASYLLVYVISMCMETILGRPIPNRFDLHFEKNLGPGKLEKNWTPIVDTILPLSNQLESAFSRDRISKEAMSKSVPNFLGFVASVRSAHKPTFDRFAAHVIVGP